MSRGLADVEASLIGSDDSDIVLGVRVTVDMGGAAIARDDSGGSKHDSCQESKDGNLHGPGRPSWAVISDCRWSEN